VSDTRAYWLLLKQVVKRPAVALALARAVLEHRAVEREFQRRLTAACPPDAPLEFPHLGLPPGEYWQRNFFSSLFLSIFKAVGIPPSRRRKYGLILHAVRGVVTAADNILDREDKGAVRLGLDGAVLPHILTGILQQGVLHEVVGELTPDPEMHRRAWHTLTHALYEIAHEEGSEENDVEIVLTPDRLLEDIHGYRGGRLLQLAFVVPETVETERRERIRAACEAVHHIGLALQVLDDVTDFLEDITRRNHNMLRSWIVHRMPDGRITDQALLDLPADVLAAPERTFPHATRQVLAHAVELALDGFDRLHRAGHPIDRVAAESLIEMMFDLRGLRHLWSHYTGTPAPCDGAKASL
jgi:hypothetical protein